MQSTCTTCPRPVPDVAYGCLECATGLAGRMGRLAGIIHELDTTVSRQDRLGSGGPRALGAEIPLPFNDHAADLATAVHGELTTWARHVSEQTGRIAPAGHPAAAAAYLLAGSVKWLRYQQVWAEAHTALMPLLGTVLRAVDRPGERQYLGPCNTEPDGGGEKCTTDVYAAPKASTGTCRTCGVTHYVDKSLEWMRDSLEDVRATPVEISGMMRRLGVKLGYSTIASYVAGRRLTDDGSGRYRIGDVLDIRFPERAVARRGDKLAQRGAQS